MSDGDPGAGNLCCISTKNQNSLKKQGFDKPCLYRRLVLRAYD